MAFDKRRKGRQDLRNIQEQAGDVSLLNRTAPRVFAPTRADAGRMQRATAESQRDMLEGRTLDTRRFNRQTTQNAASMAESARRFDVGRKDSQDRFDVNRRDMLDNRADTQKRFETNRQDRLTQNRNARKDSLMGKFRPGDVDEYLRKNPSAGQGQQQSQTGQTPTLKPGEEIRYDGDGNSYIYEDSTKNPQQSQQGRIVQPWQPGEVEEVLFQESSQPSRLQQHVQNLADRRDAHSQGIQDRRDSHFQNLADRRAPQGMRRPSTSGGVQLRPRVSAKAQKPADLTKQYDAIASDLVNSGIDRAELYDENDKPTAKGRAAIQFMMRGQDPGRANLATTQGNLEQEAAELQKYLDENTGFGKERGTVFTSDKAKEAEARLAEIQEELKTSPQAPQPQTGSGFRRPQEVQPSEAAQPVIGRPTLPELPSGGQRERGAATRNRDDLSAFEGVDARVGNKNGVPGVWVKDPGTGKQQFIGEGELKQHYGEDFELGKQSAQTEGDTISFRPNMMKLPDLGSSVSEQRGAFGPTPAGQTGFARPSESPASQATPQADPSTLSRFDRVDQKLGGKIIDKTLDAIDKGDTEDKRAAAPVIREMLANPDKYESQMLNKYLDSVNFWEQPVQADPQQRKEEMKIPAEQRAKNKRDRWANRYMSKVISDAAGPGVTGRGQSKVGYDKALRFYKEQNPEKTERDFELELIELQGGLRNPVLRYWQDKSETGDIEKTAAESISKRRFTARGK